MNCFSIYIYSIAPKWNERLNYELVFGPKLAELKSCIEQSDACISIYARIFVSLYLYLYLVSALLCVCLWLAAAEVLFGYCNRMYS